MHDHLCFREKMLENCLQSRDGKFSTVRLPSDFSYFRALWLSVYKVPNPVTVQSTNLAYQITRHRAYLNQSPKSHETRPKIAYGQRQIVYSTTSCKVNYSVSESPRSIQIPVILLSGSRIQGCATTLGHPKRKLCQLVYQSCTSTMLATCICERVLDYPYRRIPRRGVKECQRHVWYDNRHAYWVARKSTFTVQRETFEGENSHESVKYKISSRKLSWIHHRPDIMQSGPHPFSWRKRLRMASDPRNS